MFYMNPAKKIQLHKADQDKEALICNPKKSNAIIVASYNKNEQHYENNKHKIQSQ